MPAWRVLVFLVGTDNGMQPNARNHTRIQMAKDLNTDPVLRRRLNGIAKVPNGRIQDSSTSTTTLYTRKEVAALAKVCPHTIARDVRAGLLKEIRFNRRRLRYHAHDVSAYLEAHYPS